MERQTYTIESEDGNVLTAFRDKTEAREAGEKVAEFTPDQSFYLREYTLQ